MNKRSRRLQGSDWYQYRKLHKLELLNIYKSSNGNYRADMKDEKGRRVHHWLHPIEAKKLEDSGYLTEHPAEDSNNLFVKRT